jgi:hypothetical protein
VLVHQVDVQVDILRLLLARLLLGRQQEGVEGRTVRDSGILSNRAGPTVNKQGVEGSLFFSLRIRNQTFFGIWIQALLNPFWILRKVFITKMSRIHNTAVNDSLVAKQTKSQRWKFLVNISKHNTAKVVQWITI